jgi:putative copper export protein
LLNQIIVVAAVQMNGRMSIDVLGTSSKERKFTGGAQITLVMRTMFGKLWKSAIMAAILTLPNVIFHLLSLTFL